MGRRVQIDDGSRAREAADAMPGAMPFYPSEPELLRILFGNQVPVRAAEIIRQFEREGFPRPRNLTGRRYLPSVLDWLRRYETGTSEALPRVVTARDAPDDGIERF